MGSLANAVESNLAKLIFQAVNWPNIADNAAVGAAAQLYVSLHNANPGNAGSQATAETAYTNYVRVGVARTPAGFSVTGNAPALIQNVGAITFALCGADGDTLLYWGLGLAASGPGTLLVSGPLGPNESHLFTGTLAAPGHLAVPGSALAVNQRVMVYALGPAAMLPVGLAEGTVYYVGTVTGGDVTLSTTPDNGAPVNFTAAGAGILMPVMPLIISQNITPLFAAGALSAYFN